VRTKDNLFVRHENEEKELCNLNRDPYELLVAMEAACLGVYQKSPKNTPLGETSTFLPGIMLHL